MGSVSYKLLKKINFKNVSDAARKNVEEHLCAFCFDLANGAACLEYNDKNGDHAGVLVLALCVECTKLGRAVVERRLLNELKSLKIS